jgi:hypothetical protein
MLQFMSIRVCSNYLQIFRLSCLGSIFLKAILILHSTQNMDKAVDLINEAIKIDDKCSFAYETLGTIEVQRYIIHETCWKRYLF